MEGNDKKIDDLDFRVVRNVDLSSSERDSVHKLFAVSYQNSNHSYLEKSLATLEYIALAYHDQNLASFAVGGILETNIPRISDPQTVHLGGISCIDSNFRRMGLFGYLQGLLSMESGLMKENARFLLCGRMAHPVSRRVLSKFPGAIPETGLMLSKWHKEVGLHIAELYDVTIDPETFVVKGGGSPIGYPVMEINVTDEEWEVFKYVNRDNGDSLLCISWFPDMPEGWYPAIY